MKQHPRPIHFWHNPDAREIPADFEAFLHRLGGPTLISLDGEKRGRTRALATLLHGNEPSGAKALHQWLLSGRRPRVPVICLVGAVHTALYEEPFRHRFIPGQRDLNRCFRPPFDDAPGHIAAHFLEILDKYRPECLLDIHNTSGSSPAFGVTTRLDDIHEAIVSRFSHRLVVTDIFLGALMEISGRPCPAVTVECGGARDPASDRTAADGLEKYFMDDDLLVVPASRQTMDLYHHPVRLELEPGAAIGYADEPLPGIDVTVSTDVEQLNFGSVDPSTPLAWLGPRGTAALRVRDGAGRDVFAQFFNIRENRLYASQRVKLFMVTTNPAIAASDCLFYAAPESEHTVVRI